MFSLIQLPKLRWIPKALSASPSPQKLSLTGTKLEDTMPQNEKVQLTSTEGIRDVITELLSQYNIPYYQAPYDRDLHDLCIQECKLKRYPIDKIHGKASIAKYIFCGVIIASTGYAHLKNRSTQVFIALYTAFVTWIGDTYSRDDIGIDSFNERFVTGKKQANVGLEGFDRLLRETNLHYHSIQANVIVTSGLNFVTSTILGFETREMPVSPESDPQSYTTFLRIMSGICEAYAMFIFPPEVPVKYYVQAVPEICLGINNFNDVLSFYKEELHLAEENGNYISHEASQRGQDKIPLFRELARDVSLCISRVTNILEGSKEAKAAFQCFKGGFVSFHISLDSRYHLNDLFPSQ